MKLAFLLLLALGVLLVVFGRPFGGDRALRADHIAAPRPMLPLRFEHNDHGTVNCIACHHNFADRSGSGTCLGCHVGDPEVWPRLEQQFHDLCRGCHAERAAAGTAAGPPRACHGCHRRAAPSTG